MQLAGATAATVTDGDMSGTEQMDSWQMAVVQVIEQ